MAATKGLLFLSLIASAFATPPGRLQARQASDACEISSFVTSCLTATGTSRPAYLTPLCSGAPTRSTSVVATTTERPRTTTTITVPSSTVFSPTATATITSFSTIDATTTVTSTVSVTSGTSQVYLSTTTVSVTRTSYAYTCAGAGQTTASTPTTTGTTAGATAGDIVVKRQNVTPQCARDFQTDCGNIVLREACGSLGITASTSVVSSTSTLFTGATITATRRVTSGVSTVGNGTTITRTSTTSNLASSTELVTVTVPFTPGAISTTTVFTTTTITTATPLPTSFKILIKSTTNRTNTYVGSHRLDGGGYALGVPGDIPAGDNFQIDSSGHLIDLSTFRAIAVRYAVNVKPFLLQFSANDDAVTSGTAVIPTFSACRGQLFANYAGGATSQFGICDGTLSLGSDGSSGLDGCRLVTPRLFPASVNGTASAVSSSSSSSSSSVEPTPTGTT